MIRNARCAPSQSFTLPSYEGPLDLLLQLIRENEVDIYDIPIAEITRQYLDRLAQRQALDFTLAGEYLVMAATLLEIKSRMLLPQAPHDEEEPDPRAELVQRLLEYQKFATVVDQLREWEQFRAGLFFRTATEAADDYILPVQVTELGVADLARALQRVLDAAGVQQLEPVSAIVPQQRISLRMKMAEILRAVRHAEEGVLFVDLIESCESMVEVVVTFLALLELLRTEQIRAVQRRALGSIRLLSTRDADGSSAEQPEGSRARATA